MMHFSVTRNRRVEELASALDREAEVVQALREALIAQRTAVAANDAGSVDETSDAITRILLTLEQAKVYRTGILDAIEPAAEKDQDLPAHGRLVTARARLRGAAESVARESRINREILRRAVETGEAFLQSIFSSATPPSLVYGPSDRKDEKAGARSVIVNRVV
jgi:hypothetical protein